MNSDHSEAVTVLVVVRVAAVVVVLTLGPVFLVLTELC
jgi:hypothetical protein